MPRKQAALRRLLGDKVAELDRSPVISDMLKRILGNPAKAIPILRHSIAPIAVKFLQIYDGLPGGDRPHISIEAIAMKANIDPATLFGVIALAEKTLRGQESAMLAVHSHPDLVEKTIEAAKQPGGVQDRRMMHEAMGFLPNSKGINIVTNLFGAGAPAKPNGGKPAEEPDDDDEDDGDESFEGLFPQIAPRLEKWSESRRLALESKTG